jgi:hypothetical protein
MITAATATMRFIAFLPSSGADALLQHFRTFYTGTKVDLWPVEAHHLVDGRELWLSRIAVC